MVKKEEAFYSHLQEELRWLTQVSNRLQDNISRIEEFKEWQNHHEEMGVFLFGEKEQSIELLLDEWNDLIYEIEIVVDEYLESEENG